MRMCPPDFPPGLGSAVIAMLIIASLLILNGIRRRVGSELSSQLFIQTVFQIKRDFKVSSDLRRAARL